MTETKRFRQDKAESPIGGGGQSFRTALPVVYLRGDMDRDAHDPSRCRDTTALTLISSSLARAGYAFGDFVFFDPQPEAKIPADLASLDLDPSASLLVQTIRPCVHDDSTGKKPPYRSFHPLEKEIHRDLNSIFSHLSRSDIHLRDSIALPEKWEQLRDVTFDLYTKREDRLPVATTRMRGRLEDTTIGYVVYRRSWSERVRIPYLSLWGMNRHATLRLAYAVQRENLLLHILNSPTDALRIVLMQRSDGKELETGHYDKRMKIKVVCADLMVHEMEDGGCQTIRAPK